MIYIQMRSFLIITAFILINLTFSASTPPNWTYDNNIQCGTVLVISTNTGGVVPNYNVLYPIAYTGAIGPRLSLGLIGLSPTNLAGTSLDFLFNIQGQSFSGFLIAITITSGNFTLVSISYFSMTATYPFGFVFYNSRTSTVINSGTGIRSESVILPFPSGLTVDMTHSNFVLPFVTGVTMTKGAGSNFHLQTLVEVYDTGNCICKYKTSGSTSVVKVTNYFIIFDQTMIQQTQTRYIDTLFFIANNNVADSYSLLASNPSNYHAGINSFNYESTSGVNFNFSKSTFILSASTSYVYMNISTWNHRIRNCVSPNLYFFQSMNTCYSGCPLNSLLNSTYQFCNPCHYSCLQCTTVSASSCTFCVASRILNISSCLCSPGYYDAGAALCAVCGITCNTCTNSITCVTCASTGMVVGASGCVCTGLSTYFNSISRTCQSCDSSCAACLSLFVCTNCKNTTATVVTGGTCTCSQAATYYNSAGNNCLACGTFCASCTSFISCLSCTTANMTVAGGTCICAAQFYLNGSVCIPCLPTCLTCTSPITCTSCDTSRNFVLNTSSNLCDCAAGSFFYSNSCVISCPFGFIGSGSTCFEICGDGQLFVLACDDGNLEDGDGCDKSCSIQPRYACRDGSPTSPSVCSFNGSLDLILKKTLKSIYSNSLTFEISVSPPIKVLNLVNISNIILIGQFAVIMGNLSIIVTNITYVNGQLTILVNYKQSIQNSQFTVNLLPPNLIQAWALKPSTTTFTINPNNNQLAIFYPDDIYFAADSLSKGMSSLSFLALGLTGFGLIFGRSIVLQMITAIQVCYISLTLIMYEHPYLGAIAESGKYLNGYNQIFVNFPELFTFTHPSTTKAIESIGYKAEYLYNINYSIILISLLISFSGILLVLLIFKIAKSLIEKVLKFIGFELTLFFITFTTVSFIFSFCVTAIYDQNTGEYALGMVVAAFSQLPLIYITIMLIKKQNLFGDTISALKPENQNHHLILLLQRTLLGLCIGVASLLPRIAPVVLCCMQISYLKYLHSKLPYKDRFMNLRSGLNEGTLLLVIVVCLEGDSILVPLVLGFCMAAQFVIGMVGAVVYTVMRCRQKKVQQQATLLGMETKQSERHSPEKEEGEEFDTSEHNLKDKFEVIALGANIQNRIRKKRKTRGNEF